MLLTWVNKDCLVIIEKVKYVIWDIYLFIIGLHLPFLLMAKKTPRVFLSSVRLLVEWGTFAPLKSVAQTGPVLLKAVVGFRHF